MTAIMTLNALLPVRYWCSSVHGCTDILEQGIGSLLTSRGCKGLIEHIIQYMYSLCSPSWGAVTVVGYVFTDLRIYPPPSPSAGGTPRRGPPNQIIAGSAHLVRSYAWTTPHTRLRCRR